MKHGWIIPEALPAGGRLANPIARADAMAESAKAAVARGSRILLFPELALTGATCHDLLLTPTMAAGANAALARFAEATAELDALIALGLPIFCGGGLVNAVALLSRGEILGLVPKSVRPPRSAALDARLFLGAPELDSVLLLGRRVPFGRGLIFACREMPSLKVAVLVGEDIASPLSRIGALAAAGATLVLNPCALADTVGALARREGLLASESGRNLCAILSANADESESGTDALFSPGAVLASHGELLPMPATVDTGELAFLRAREGFPFEPAAKIIDFSLEMRETRLLHPPKQNPFLPKAEGEIAARCREIYRIQSRALALRAERAYAKALVLGVSGGLDSTLALLVAVKAAELAPGLSVIAVTMPGFGTTRRTKSNAERLAEALGAELRVVDICASVRQHFADIGHDEGDHSVVYENAQARERTQILMDMANACGGLVVGTGDLSELALGWATYNGDHMSMYGVNAGLPKTMMRHTVATIAGDLATGGNPAAAEILSAVLDTPVSPELLPPSEDGEIAQCTEALVGPYDLHDFFLYHLVRRGAPPEKILRLAVSAFDSVFDEKTIRLWLSTFCRRFFSQQFKRSCLPDGPMIGGLSLSPRAAFAMPSDASGELWQSEIKRAPVYRKDGTTLG